MNTFSLPSKGEYPSYYETYLEKIPEVPFSELISSQIAEIRNLFSSKPLGWESIAYAEGKWTPKEVLGHLIDTERIMTFRALCFSRGEKQSLPGFDENQYVLNANFQKVSLDDLLEDFEAQRKALLTLVKTISESTLDLVGNANQKPISPRALFWIIPGHFIHHLQVLNSRY
ncbi:DinB family protein [Algoriphagus sp. AK58]|uniref:DinB family protein n=1 Tax=Algoriphagus sp. AK58 TaxID=1406877 RepID=UPI00164F5B28|nr:DinB family protein [Algoriphagus sp. AK58]